DKSVTLSQTPATDRQHTKTLNLDQSHYLVSSPLLSSLLSPLILSSPSFQLLFSSSLPRLLCSFRSLLSPPILCPLLFFPLLLSPPLPSPFLSPLLSSPPLT